MEEKQRDYQLLVHLIKTVANKQDLSHKDIEEIKVNLAKIVEWKGNSDLDTRVTKLGNYKWFILGASAAIGTISSVLFEVLK